MKHYEKIKKIRNDMNLTLQQVRDLGASMMGPQKTISISTIKRIEAGQAHKFSSLVTYCFILGISMKELFKGTELDECLLLKKKERTSGYTFDEQAGSTIINNPNQSFLAQEFLLMPGGETLLDRAPRNKGKYEKLIYLISGHLICVIDDKEMLLKGGDSLSFDSTKPHYFKNTAKAKCRFIVVENPGRL